MKPLPQKFYFHRGWAEMILTLDTAHQVAVFEAITKLIFQGKDTDLGGDAGKVWTAIKKDDRFKSQLS